MQLADLLLQASCKIIFNRWLIIFLIVFLLFRNEDVVLLQLLQFVQLRVIGSLDELFVILQDLNFLFKLVNVILSIIGFFFELLDGVSIASLLLLVEV